MLTCFLRSSLMVKDEIPMSYFLPCTPVMMEANLAVCHSVFTPNFRATRLKMSTSKPWIVFPSAARNSFGAYVESVPILITPALLMLSGSLAASSALTLLVAVGAFEPSAAGSPPRVSEPQALRAKTPAAATASPHRIRTFTSPPFRPGQLAARVTSWPGQGWVTPDHEILTR